MQEGEVTDTKTVDTGLVASVVAAMSNDDGLKAVTFNRMRREVDSDTKMQQLVKEILEYPADENFPICLATFNRYREDLSVLDGDWSESDSARSTQE